VTSDRQQWTWVCDTAPPRWLIIPTETDDDWMSWASELVRDSLTPLPEAAPLLDEDALESLAHGALERLILFSAEVPRTDRVVAAVGVAGRTPVPVHLTVAVHEPAQPADLLAACGASGGNPIDPPTVEYLTLTGGDGVKVTRIDRDESGTVWVSIALARRTEVADTLLVWRTTDLVLVPFMSDLIEELLTAVRIEQVSAWLAT
jgi:hypothetical protein